MCRKEDNVDKKKMLKPYPAQTRSSLMAQKLKTFSRLGITLILFLLVTTDLSRPTEDEERVQQRNWRETLDFLETEFTALVDYDLELLDDDAANHTARRSCQWTSPNESKQVADCIHKNLPNYTRSLPEVLFLGDSTMARLWYQFFQRSMPYFMPLKSNDFCNCETRVLDRCYESEDYNRESIFPDKVYGKARRKPNPLVGEGPTSYGINGGFKRGCMDCRSCHSRMWFCSDLCKYTAPSFFGVEFSRDVEIQTIRSSTTQEATAYLIATRFEPDYRRKLCVVNVGMHDFTIANMTKNKFLRNVKWYFSLLKPNCEHLLWIGLNQVIELPKYPQNNSQIIEWNRGIDRLLQTPEFRNWTSSLDVFTVTETWEHENPVHLQPSYYEELASILAKAVLVDPKPDYF